MPDLLGTHTQEPTVQIESAYKKPLTLAEQLAKRNGELYLELARHYAKAEDRNNAASCCLEGIHLMFGISRPLAVRDQLDDVLRMIDPLKEIATRIRSCMRRTPTDDSRGPKPRRATQPGAPYSPGRKRPDFAATPSKFDRNSNLEYHMQNGVCHEVSNPDYRRDGNPLF